MIFKRNTIAIAAAVAMAAPIATSGAALAQTEAPSAPMQQQQQAPAAQDFSDNTLRSFAVAFLEVDQINRTYTPQLEQAESPEQQQEIQQQASAEMVEAVEGSDGISVQEYTSIMQAAQANPELAQKLTEYIGEASQQAPAN